jgi:hypothetical protein
MLYHMKNNAQLLFHLNIFAINVHFFYLVDSGDHDTNSFHPNLLLHPLINIWDTYQTYNPELLPELLVENTDLVDFVKEHPY